MKDVVDPLDGWFNREIIDNHIPISNNDILGYLFSFLRDLLVKFCNRLQSSKVAFELFAYNAEKLPIYVQNT